MDSVTRKGGLLYPMLVIAAISVIVFSATGIATMLGWLPSAFSGRDPGAALRSDRADHRTAQRPPHDQQLAASAPAVCGDCGVVESIRAVESQGRTGWPGASGGAVPGGVLDSQVGHGGGRTAATVIAAGAGAYVGNEIEKNALKSVRYRVLVRMEDGTYRTVHEATQPAYSVGENVRLNERGIAVAAR